MSETTRPTHTQFLSHNVGEKRPEGESDRSFPAYDEVKNARRFVSSVHILLMV
jgi:hypothetical protein